MLKSLLRVKITKDIAYLKRVITLAQGKPHDNRAALMNETRSTAKGATKQIVNDMINIGERTMLNQ